MNEFDKIAKFLLEGISDYEMKNETIKGKDMIQISGEVNDVIVEIIVEPEHLAVGGYTRPAKIYKVAMKEDENSQIYMMLSDDFPKDVNENLAKAFEGEYAQRKLARKNKSDDERRAECLKFLEGKI